MANQADDKDFETPLSEESSSRQTHQQELVAMESVMLNRASSLLKRQRDSEEVEEQPGTCTTRYYIVWCVSRIVK